MWQLFLFMNFLFSLKDTHVIFVLSRPRWNLKSFHFVACHLVIFQFLFLLQRKPNLTSSFIVVFQKINFNVVLLKTFLNEIQKNVWKIFSLDLSAVYLLAWFNTLTLKSLTITKGKTSLDVFVFLQLIKFYESKRSILGRGWPTNI